MSERLTLAEELEQLVLPLIAFTSDAKWHPLGTAFVAGVLNPKTALLITAAHTIDFVVALDQPRPKQAPGIPLAFQTQPKSIDLRSTRMRAGLYGGAGKFTLAEIQRTWRVNECDVALSVASLPSDSPVTFTRHLAIDSSPMTLGTPVTAAGYPRMCASFVTPPDYDRQDFQVEFSRQLHFRSGNVSMLCPHGIGIHRWPGFLVNAAFDSGMSGGPIVDFSRDVPVVRGIVGGDLSDNESDGSLGSGVQAFGSTLWPFLDAELDFAVRLEGVGDAVPVERVIDLVRLNALDDRGDPLQHFRARNTDAGRFLSWEEAVVREDGTD